MTPSCKISLPGTAGVHAVLPCLWVGLVAGLLAGLLVACTGPSRPGPAPPRASVPGPPARASQPAQAPHLGRPYDVIPGESLLTILVYRAGALAKMGHNHVIASHDVSGTVYVADNLLQSSVEIQLPVLGLTVDEASLRSREGNDFSAAVPDDAKEGTRKNMLSEALLDGARSPRITLRSTALDVADSGNVRVHLQVIVRQASHDLLIPAHYDLQPGQVTVTGELPLKQSDLGLTPFSAMLGALQVQDEMRVKFRFVARAAAPR